MRGVLTYHSIDESGSPVSLEPAVFRRHVEWLASGRVRVVELATLLRLPPASDAVAVTFDDGFRNFVTRAWPLLRELELPVTLFVVTAHVGGFNDWGPPAERKRIPRLPLLDWRRLGKLAEEGVELGSHTVSHPDLSKLSPREVERELARSAERIEAETGHRPRCFAYPYGRAENAERSVRQTYRLACTTAHRELRADDPAHRVPRLEARYFDRRHLDGWGGAAFRGRLRIRAGLRSVRESVVGGRA